MQQPLVDVVQGIRHNLVVMKQQALVAGYGASIGHNFVVMEQQVYRNMYNSSVYNKTRARSQKLLGWAKTKNNSGTKFI